MSDRTNWESYWPSDDELLGRAVLRASEGKDRERWVNVANVFSIGSTLARALVERYVDDMGNLKP